MPSRLFVLLSILAVLASPTFAQRTRQPQQKWEYKILDFCRQDDRLTDIQKLGEEGWELVSTDVGISGEGANSCSKYFFKRPKRAGTEPPTLQQAAKLAAPKCSLPLEKAPTVRGLHLGMSLEEVLALFPGSAENYQINRSLKGADLPSRYGVANLSFHFSAYPNSKAIFEQIDSYTLTLLDGKLMRINISWGSSDPQRFSWTHESLASKLAETFGLPDSDSWVKGNFDNQKQLVCNGFELVSSNSLQRIDFGNQVVPVSNNWTTLIISDTTLKKILEQRIKADQEKKWHDFKF